jgi:hypothetical protein
MPTVSRFPTNGNLLSRQDSGNGLHQR